MNLSVNESMNISLRKQKIKTLFKTILMMAIFFIVLKELIGIISSFDMDKFNIYIKELSGFNILTIIALGIISYIPLSLYDFVLKKRVGINLDNKKLYKFSWIASSIASIAGFGGSTALALKGHFYKDYIDDKKLLLKEVSKIIALNLTGFSITCLVYISMSFGKLPMNNFKSVGIVIISLYIPLVLGYFAYKYLKGNEVDKVDVKDCIKIMLLSALEWLTTIVLIYSIVLILGIKISLIQFFPVFVVSIVVAIVSMSPGGIGSFDLSFMLGLQGLGIPGEKVLLAIFLYRVSYYVIPLLIGFVLYGHEIFIKMENESINNIKDKVSKISYSVAVMLIFLSGTIILAHGAIPHTIDSVSILRDTSHLLMMSKEEIVHLNGMFIIIGFLLIAICRLMTYKSKEVYNLTIGLAICIAMIGMVRKVGYIGTGSTIVLILALLASKKEFYRESFIMKWESFCLDMLILTGFLILFISTRNSNIHWKYVFYSQTTLTFGIIGFVVAVGFLGFMYYKHKFNEFEKIQLKDCESELEYILSKYDGSHMTHYIYLDDKFVYLNKDKDVLIQYQICSDKIFILGNPIGNESKFIDTIKTLSKESDLYGYALVFCSIDESLIPYLKDMGYKFMKLGEEASVNLDEFTLEGRKMKSVRNALSRVTKQEYTFEVVQPPFSDEFMNNLKEVSDDWLGDRKEKGFSIGSFKVDYLSREPIAIVRNKDNEIKGFTNIMPMYDNTTLSIDLMRFSQDSCNGIMDFIFVNLFNYGKEQGYSKFNMGLSPLSHVEENNCAHTKEKIVNFVYSHGDKIYSFKGLKNFKQKYCEGWDGVYIAYKKRRAIVPTIIQAMLLIIR